MIFSLILFIFNVIIEQNLIIYIFLLVIINTAKINHALKEIRKLNKFRRSIISVNPI